MADNSEWAYQSIVEEYGAAAAMALAERVRERLRESQHTMSGEGSGLQSTWEEICVQVQGEETPYWDAYVMMIRDTVSSELFLLPRHEQAAIWLWTYEGEDWLAALCDVGEPAVDGTDRGAVGNHRLKLDLSDVPISEDDVFRTLMRCHIHTMAAEDESAAVAEFLNQYLDDDEVEGEDDDEEVEGGGDQSTPNLVDCKLVSAGSKPGAGSGDFWTCTIPLESFNALKQAGIVTQGADAIPATTVADKCWLIEGLAIVTTSELFTRLARGEVLSVLGGPYDTAAEAAGAASGLVGLEPGRSAGGN